MPWIISGIGHPSDAAVAANVGGHALERHHRRGAGILCDLRLLGRDDVHDHAALEHLGEARLDRERGLLARGVAVVAHRGSSVAGAVGCHSDESSRPSLYAMARDSPATELARGPWDPRALHGGAPAALLVHALQRCEPRPDLRLARVTYEFVRPVPIGELHVAARVTRPGRRVMLLEAIDARRRSDRGRARAGAPGPPQRRSASRRPSRRRSPRRSGSAERLSQPRPDVRQRRGRDPLRRGQVPRARRATAWFRLRHPIVAGEPITPFERAAAAGDFGNGIASVLSWEDHVFINPDLTLYFEREPRGEWVASAIADADRARRRRRRREHPLGPRGPDRARDPGAARRPPLSRAT